MDEETKRRLKREYATKEKIGEAEARIRRICIDLDNHYTTHIRPNGYKAMLVAVSREAAVTYKKQLDKLNAPRSKIIMTSNLGDEKRRRDDASYFNDIANIFNEALNQDRERKKLGFSTQFEFALFEELQAAGNKEEHGLSSKEITKTIFDNILEETNIIGWKTKKGSEKRISVSIYDILSKNGFQEKRINDLIPKIIDLAKQTL